VESEKNWTVESEKNWKVEGVKMNGGEWEELKGSQKLSRKESGWEHVKRKRCVVEFLTRCFSVPLPTLG
jgi:hypothetical protein